jgi:hypothetical protein
VAVEATQAVGDVGSGAEDKSCALIEHSVGEAERYHRVLRWMLDEYPYLVRQLSVFYRHATKGYPGGGEFAGRVSPRLGTRSCKEHKGSGCRERNTLRHVWFVLP